MRKNLAKLIPRINMFNFHCTEDSAEYKYLDPLLSDKEVDALLKMKVRKPEYRTDMARIFKLSEAETSEVIDRLTKIGFLRLHH